MNNLNENIKGDQKEKNMIRRQVYGIVAPAGLILMALAFTMGFLAKDYGVMLAKSEAYQDLYSTLVDIKVEARESKKRVDSIKYKSEEIISLHKKLQLLSEGTTPEKIGDYVLQTNNFKERFRWKVVDPLNKEPFVTDLIYRITITEGEENNYRNAYLYPTVVTREEMYGNWARSEYFVLNRNNKQRIESGYLAKRIIKLEYYRR